MAIFPSNKQALSIFPIGNGNGHIEEASIYDDEEDSGDEIEFVLPKNDEDVLETLVRSGLAAPLPQETANDEPRSLLKRLDRHELTITERRCSYDVKGISSVASHQTVPLGNGNGSGILSPPSRGTDSCSEAEDIEQLLDYCVRSQESGSLLQAASGNGSDLVDHPNGTPPSQKPLVRKRRTRKTISPNDPAEALTEMSVRGLNLFRYATVNDGLYECVECSKDGDQKTFKNKYSFQRHAFLYHEGQQRKVFPCSICSKEFSRPDKMKNHFRMTHGGLASATATSAVYEGKSDPAMTAQSFLPNQSVDLVQLHLQLQQQHLQQFQQPQQHHQQHHQQQQSTSDEEQQLQEELDKRRQQEQDVLKIRQAVNAITLRQLQQIRFQQQQQQQQQEQESQPDQRLPQASQPVAELSQRKISNSNLEPSVPSQQLLVHGATNGQ